VFTVPDIDCLHTYCGMCLPYLLLIVFTQLVADCILVFVANYATVLADDHIYSACYDVYSACY
jgi:hypothetical protein